MVAVHTFVVFIKNYFNMKKYNSYNRGEISFGLEILIFVVIIFIIWVLMGGARKAPETKPFITPLSDQVNPGMKYGPGDLRN